MAVDSSKISKSVASTRSAMNLFPLYILGMLIRAWLLSGEGEKILLTAIWKTREFAEFNFQTLDCQIFRLNIKQVRIFATIPIYTY